MTTHQCTPTTNRQHNSKRLCIIEARGTRGRGRPCAVFPFAVTSSALLAAAYFFPLPFLFFPVALPLPCALPELAAAAFSARTSSFSASSASAAPRSP